MSPLILPLLVFLAPLAFSPGPGNMVFAASGARFGLRATLPANGGYHLATFVVTLLIGLGFVGAMTALPELFAAIRTAGALYVLWLAVCFVRAGKASAAEARPLTFRDGVILLLLNPKAYVIIGLMFTQFLSDQQRSGAGTVFLITAIFTLNNLVSFLLWTAFGDILARRFRHTGRARVMNGVFGAMLGAAGIWMLIPGPAS